MQFPICPSSAAAAAFGGGASLFSIQYYNLGSFEVYVGQAAAAVEVYNAVGAEVWKSPSSQPFITASTGLTSFSDDSGNVEISTASIAAPCQSPRIAQTSPLSNNIVSISGTFADKDEQCAGWTWELQFSPAEQDESILAFNASVNGDGVQNVYVAFESPREETFFGLGEQSGLGDLRGWRIPIWTREQGVGRGAEPVTSLLNSNPSLAGAFAGGSALTSYTAIASYATSIGRFLVLDGTNFALFDLASNETALPFVDTAAAQLAGNTSIGNRAGTSSTTVQILYEGTSVAGYTGRSSSSSSSKGNAILDAISSITTITGRQPRLPSWALDGAILGIQGGKDKIEGIIEAAINASLPLAAVWLQDWSGTRLQAGAYNVSISRLWWNWENDETLYPDWADWVEYLRHWYTVRTMNYVNTFLANVSSKSTGYRRNIYEEAAREGRLVLNATAAGEGRPGIPWTVTSGPGIDAGLLDLSNATTVSWFKDLVKEQYYSASIFGGMEDFGEYLSVAPSVSISNGTVSPRSFHNAYPGVWAQLLREVVEELGLEDEVIGFHRSANTFSTRHTNLFWVGDQNVDTSRADGIRASLSTTLHLGFSGWAQSHSDIGGYTTLLSPSGNVTRSPALLGRWGELAAFSGAVFRTHEGNIPQVNAQVYSSNDTLKYHAYNSRLFVALRAYREHLLEQYQERGWPLVRHPVVYAPSDVRARAVVDEVFWLGEAVLVAPVYSETEQRLEVELPRVEVDSEGVAVGEGVRYKHLWFGKLYEPGQKVVVEAPWGRPGVFVRWPLREGEGELLRGLFEFAEGEDAGVLTA